MNAAQALRRAYTRAIKDKPRMKKDGHINNAFQQIIRDLHKDPDNLRQKGREVVDSWDRTHDLAEEAVLVFLPDEYDEILDDVIDLFHDVVDDAAEEAGEFVRPEPI